MAMRLPEYSLLYDDLYYSEDDHLIYWICLNFCPEANFTATVCVRGRCKSAVYRCLAAFALSAVHNISCVCCFAPASEWM